MNKKLITILLIKSLLIWAYKTVGEDNDIGTQRMIVIT